jgi:hypothetical protein
MALAMAAWLTVMLVSDAWPPASKKSKKSAVSKA